MAGWISRHTKLFLSYRRLVTWSWTLASEEITVENKKSNSIYPRFVIFPDRVSSVVRDLRTAERYQLCVMSRVTLSRFMAYVCTSQPL